jgi:hypothetical protein
MSMPDLERHLVCSLRAGSDLDEVGAHADRARLAERRGEGSAVAVRVVLLARRPAVLTTLPLRT